MATINNNNVGPAGEVISRSAVNTKFTEVATATATGALATDNVRSEGVDRRTLAGSRAEPLAHLSYTDNGTANGNYASKTGVASFPVSHGTGLELSPNFTLKDGDLLRINFTIRLKNHNDATYIPMFSAAGPTLSIGALFFPVWKTAGSGSWAVLPNQAALDSTIAAGAFIPFNDSSLKTDSSAWCSMEGIASGAIRDCRNTIHGAFYYKRTGGDLLVDKVRLHARAPVAYEWDAGSSAKVIRAPNWGAAPYSSGSWPTSFTFNMGEGQISMMVIRGDS